MRSQKCASLFIILLAAWVPALPAATGTFSGTVTAGGAGVGGLLVEIFDHNGEYVTTAVTSDTEAIGAYLSPELSPGTYFAKTWNQVGLINELYDDIPCWFWCEITAGTAIQVVAGANQPGIDFDLDTGGTFSGTVTDHDSGLPLEGVIVDIFDSTGTWIANPSTDAAGLYRSSGLPAGDYFARTWNTIGYVNELFDDNPCPPVCDPLENGTVIAVTLGTNTPGIDFVLAKAGSIAGFIHDRGTALPVEGLVVDFWDSEDRHMAATVSESGGSYQIGNLPAGIYYATTWNDLGYPSALYHGFECQGCSPSLGTPIVVVAETTTAGIDFDLAPGGYLSGTVSQTGSGVGLADIHVELWSKEGHLIAWEPTLADGSYSTSWVLPTGSYYVKTWNDQGYINQIHPALPCASCNATDGQTVRIETGQTTSGVDFALSPGGSITGTVTLPDPNDAPLITIQVRDDEGRWVWSQSPPTSSGEYGIDVGLPSGTYFVRTASGRPYVNEVWDNHPCLANCDVVVDGDPITVISPATTTNVDFDLDPGVKLTGTVKDAGTLLAIDDSLVEIFDAAAERVAGCSVAPTGSFTCRQAIPPGTYYAATANYAGYLDELHADPPNVCVGGGSFCDVLQGTPIEVGLGTPPDDLHFTLDRGGWIEGAVFDSHWRRSLAGLDLLLFDDQGSPVANMFWPRPRSLAIGGSFISCGLPAGTYHARTDTESIGGYHADELWDDILCVLGCNVRNGTEITVVDGVATTGVVFELSGLVFADGFESGDTARWRPEPP